MMIRAGNSVRPVYSSENQKMSIERYRNRFPLRFRKFLSFTIFFAVFMPMFAQERCLQTGRNDRYASKDTNAVSFSVHVAGNPANFFVASGLRTDAEIYVQFGEQGRGLKVYQGGMVIYENPAVFTSPNIAYNIKVQQNQIFRNDSLIYDFPDPIQSISIGTWKVPACFNTFPWSEWEFVGDWDIPVQMDTLYADTVTVFWDANTEVDLAGYYLRYWHSGETKRKTAILPNLTMKNIGINTSGIYHFELAAFDTANNYSAYAQTPLVYISIDSTVLPHPDTLDCEIPDSLVLAYEIFDLNSDCKLNMRDATIFEATMFSAVGDSNYIEQFDFNNDGRIDIRDKQRGWGYWGAMQ